MISTATINRIGLTIALGGLFWAGFTTLAFIVALMAFHAVAWVSGGLIRGFRLLCREIDPAEIRAAQLKLVAHPDADLSAHMDELYVNEALKTMEGR